MSEFAVVYVLQVGDEYYPALHGVYSTREAAVAGWMDYHANMKEGYRIKSGKRKGQFPKWVEKDFAEERLRKNAESWIQEFPLQ